MNSFYEYMDQDFFPGEVYRYQASSYGTDAMSKVDALNQLRMDFDLAEVRDGPMDPTAFETFATLRSNPNALFAAKISQTLPKPLVNGTIPGFSANSFLGV